jgi:hypothetical protein
MSIELLANDLVHRHLQQAAQDALANQLPRSSARRVDVAARQYLADALRALATRLDPCLACEPSLVSVRSR